MEEEKAFYKLEPSNKARPVLICGTFISSKNYELDIDSVYEFVLGAMENYDVERDFRNSNHSLVLESFKKFYESINK